MRPFATAIAFCGTIVITIAYGQTPAAIPDVEAMEQFLKHSTAHIISATEVDRIHSNQAHAVVTALLVEDATQTPSRLRGIHIALVDGATKDQLYLTEDVMKRVSQALDDISTGLPKYLSRRSSLKLPPQQHCFGSGTFWQQQGHTFRASECFSPSNDSYLSVATGTATFRFPALDPARFAAAIARATQALKTM
jgi:hypothetical protein